jgi:hypothetical protein
MHAPSFRPYHLVPRVVCLQTTLKLPFMSSPVHLDLLALPIISDAFRLGESHAHSCAVASARPALAAPPLGQRHLACVCDEGAAGCAMRTAHGCPRDD